MKSLVIVALAMSVVGCAMPPPKVWYRDGGNQEQFSRDRLTCMQYGMQSAQANGLGGNLFVQTWIDDEAAKCLQSLGYQQR